MYSYLINIFKKIFIEHISFYISVLLLTNLPLVMTWLQSYTVLKNRRLLYNLLLKSCFSFCLYE